ncbi:MAG: branched-chain-amino-acid transaminase [Endomicrobium sp.]|nr:branched-chain-amino-acid transaminase [Endomicrobium sp.]
MKIFLDGEFVEKEDAKISVFDHGFLYGDGIFEGIRAYNGRVFRLNEHLDRLWGSAKAVNLKIPMFKKDMEKVLIKTLSVNKISEAYVRLIVTRGCGGLSLDPQNCTKKSSVIIIPDLVEMYTQEIYEKGIEIVSVSTRKIKQDSLSSNVKSLNYLNNILAKIESVKSGAADGVMLNNDGYVVGCTSDNIFVVKDDDLYTPDGCEGALIGITRDAVIELARNKSKIPVKERRLSLYDVYTADECFLTGTAAEIIPVIAVDSRLIGDGKPGRMTLKLMKEFKALVHSSGTPIK